ncbi:Slp family lipoprotein [Nitrospira sp. Nam74]
MMSARISMPLLLASLMWLSSCTSYNVVPQDLQPQVDYTVRFTEVLNAPDQYRGRTVVFGGEVLSAKRLKDGTRIEVLQLPLDRYQAPMYDRTASEGRFLAFEKDFLDPAKLPPGTRVTIVGDITGTMTQPLDETEYTFPTVEVKKLTVWPRIDSAYSRPYYPYRGPYSYGYGGFRRWGPWGPYPYSPYWW